MARMIDLTNKKYGKLTVIKLTGERGRSAPLSKKPGWRINNKQPVEYKIFRETN